MPHKNKNKTNSRCRTYNEHDKSKLEQPSIHNHVNINYYFTDDELEVVKTTLKIKETSGLPLVIAATILHKPDLITLLLNEGQNVNEVGQNHMTPLLWAVKSRNLELIDLLLERGADPIFTNNNGDHALLLALECKSWDEQTFVLFWNKVRSITFVDLEYMSKNGRTMLHTAIRREWVELTKALIKRNADINVSNFNGVTPLMLASFRGHLELVNILLTSGANVMLEDSNGYMPLCYAMVSVITKQTKLPHHVVDKLIKTLEVSGMPFRRYVATRLQLIHKHKCNEIKGQVILNMLGMIFKYILKFSKGAVQLLLEFDIFGVLTEAVEKYMKDPEHLQNVFSVINELINSSKYVSNQQLCRTEESILLINLFSKGGLNTCFGIIQKFITDKSYGSVISLAWSCLMKIALIKGPGKIWLKNRYDKVLPLYEKCFVEQNETIVQTESHGIQIPNELLASYHELMVNIKRENRASLHVDHNVDKKHSYLAPKTSDSRAVHQADNKQKNNSNSKKTKRRKKALKAQMVKIKTADMAERLSNTGKKILEQKAVSKTAFDQTTQSNENSDKEIVKVNETLSCDSFQSLNFSMLTNNQPHICPVDKKYIDAHLRPGSYEISFEMEAEEQSELLNDLESLALIAERKGDETGLLYPSLNNATGGDASASGYITYLLKSSLKYVTELFVAIIQQYKNQWNAEREQNMNIFCNDRATEENRNMLHELEDKYLERAQNEFNKLLSCMRNVGFKSITECRIAADKLETILRNHEIWEKSLTEDVTLKSVNPIVYEESEERDVTKEYDSFARLLEGLLSDGSCNYLILEETTKPTSVLNTSNYMNTSPDDIYVTETKALPKKTLQDETKTEQDKYTTLTHAYHLTESIMAMCDENEEEILEEEVGEELEQSGSSKMGVHKRQTLQESLSILPKFEDEKVILEELKRSVNNSGNYIPIPKTTSRWSLQIEELRKMTTYQICLDGDVRLSCEKRESLVIASGGNFNTVELGFDGNERPLAVKRIAKEQCVCKLMKNLLNPLMGLRNANLLHYFACDYEENELLLATPLCEYNIGEYVMFMKQSPKVVILPVDIVKQFLAGLRFLHNRDEPIIHGNLKPSNIFIDLRGVVRIAEFGMQTALFKLVIASESSIIWFSRETLNGFKESSIIECSCASDVQVAGMLIHFILTAGKHPYGEKLEDILKNLEKSVPQLSTTDVDLHDLVSWMLLYDPSERPLINQVLSHVFFWQPDRKWRFVLACGGLKPHGGKNKLSISDLHSYIDKISTKENIKGNWVSATKRRFPNLPFIKESDDTPTGLLRFIRTCIENQALYCVNIDFELRTFILANFPAFPLSLYRILETTPWLENEIFQPFTTVDSVSA